MAVYFSDGTTPLIGPDSYLANTSPIGIRSGNFRGLTSNGRPVIDLVVLDATRGIEYLQNNTFGVFSLAHTTTTTVTSPMGMIPTDFNGDGFTDLIVYNNSTQYQVFLGDGAGNFTAGQTGTLLSGATGPVITADFNLDGKPDVAFSVSGSLIGIGLNQCY